MPRWFATVLSAAVSGGLNGRLNANHRRRIRIMDKEINVLALVKGEEKFIFLFDDANRDQTLRQLARYAADPELEFSWYDAAMLSRKIREAVPTDEDYLMDNELGSLSVEDFQ